jgi:formylglycine-generating enzyme required for sulfatase activity
VTTRTGDKQRRAALALSALLLAAACRDRSGTTTEVTDAAAAIGSVLAPTPTAPTSRKGMAWIPGGALVAGTAPDTLPRIADEEMSGEQVILKGFHIDIYPYPNEEGAIPLTNVTQTDAAALCAEHDKRLCSELEWERACKGPDNWVYEYGDRYRPERCGTGAAPSLRPNGLRVGCASEYGVADLHGGAWEWTDSPWGRGSQRALITVRGGNAQAGELVGRCANAMGRPAHMKSSTVGFRCCVGPRNSAEVVLSVDKITKLKHRDARDSALTAKLTDSLPAAASAELPPQPPFQVDRLWDWWPIGNERLVLGGGCAGSGGRGACGLIIARPTLAGVQVLGWAGSGKWAPVARAEGDYREIWVYGGDDLGSFKRALTYAFGRVSVGEKERRLPRTSKKSEKGKKKRAR